MAQAVTEESTDDEVTLVPTRRETSHRESTDLDSPVLAEVPHEPSKTYAGSKIKSSLGPPGFNEAGYQVGNHLSGSLPLNGWILHAFKAPSLFCVFSSLHNVGQAPLEPHACVLELTL